VPSRSIGNASRFLKLHGICNNVFGGNGNASIIGGAGLSSIFLGDGENVVHLSGALNTIVLGNGNNVVTSGTGQGCLIVNAEDVIVTYDNKVTAILALHLPVAAGRLQKPLAAARLG
jgi:hypothetical protein